MTREELEIELEKCCDYLDSNEIDVIFRQKDRDLLRYYHQHFTTQAEPIYGDFKEHIRICERFVAIRQLLHEMAS